MKAIGGKSLYGASIGILMLDAKFPRIRGDMGNALSWPFPVHYKIVPKATPDLIVKKGAIGMLDNFIEAGRSLVADGVDGITTNCGFLSIFQQELADALGVPVATSSLMQTRMVNSLLPANKRAGILTICQSALTPAHLAAAMVPADTPIATTENRREFSRVILANEERMDTLLACQDNIDAALSLAAQPDVGAIILECTNMVPYAAAIRQATGLPVFSVYNFISWFHAALTPPSFGQMPHQQDRPYSHRDSEG